MNDRKLSALMRRFENAEQLSDEALDAAIRKTRDREEHSAIRRLRKAGWFNLRLTAAEADRIIRTAVDQADVDQTERSRLWHLETEQAARERARRPTLTPWRRPRKRAAF